MTAALRDASVALHHACEQRIGLAMGLCLDRAARSLRRAGLPALADRADALGSDITPLGALDRLRDDVDRIMEAMR